MLKKFLTDQIVMGANVPLPANSPFGSLAACWGEIKQLPLIPTQKKMRNLLIDLIVSPAPQLFSVSSSLFVHVWNLWANHITQLDWTGDQMARWPTPPFPGGELGERRQNQKRLRLGYNFSADGENNGAEYFLEENRKMRGSH